MKERTHQILKSLSLCTSLLAAGFITGAGTLAIWATNVGILDDDIRLRFLFMLGMPAIIFLGLIPGLILQIIDGVSKLKSCKDSTVEQNPSSESPSSIRTGER